jgi:hypothetical protein
LARLHFSRIDASKSSFATAFRAFANDHSCANATIERSKMENERQRAEIAAKSSTRETQSAEGLNEVNTGDRRS